MRDFIRLEKERSGPLLKYFAGRRVAEIDAESIRAYQKARSKAVSNRTVNLETKLLRQVLKVAKVWAHTADDYKRLPEDSHGPGRALEEHEEKLLFDVARSKPGWDAAFYAALIASKTTMRGHELKALRISNIDLIDREVIVSKSKTKGGTGRRIPLDDVALWAFARLTERAAALGSTEGEHFLFPAFEYKRTKTGRSVSGTGYDPTRHQKTWRTAWKNLTKETANRAGQLAYDASIQAGASPEAAEMKRKKAMAPLIGLRFHDLRHTAITKLAESGEASDQTIMEIAGHLSRKMLEHYSHIRNAAKRKAIEAMRGYVPEEMVPATSEKVQ